MLTDEPSPRVVLGLITCRNPEGLRKLLSHLSDESRRWLSRIVVVDNDPGAEAMALVEVLNREGSVPAIEAFLEPRLGIPFARNRVLAEAESEPYDYLAMLDDDEYPSHHWLSALIHCAQQYDADVVGGRVVPVFEHAPEPPVLALDYAKVGGRYRHGRACVESTANVLLSRRVLRAFRGNAFNIDYAMSGSSDVELFRRMFDDGFTHAIAGDAVVYEDIPRFRLSPEWQLQRSYRTANGLTRTRILHRGYVRTLGLEMLNGAGLLLQAALWRLSRPGDSRAAFRARRNVGRVRGKFDGFIGRRADEYASVDYRGNCGKH